MKFPRFKWYYMLAGLLTFEWGNKTEHFSGWSQILIGLAVWVSFFALLDVQNWKDDERERRK